MPDSVDRPAPLSTRTPPPATIGITPVRVEVRGSDGPEGDQVRVGLVRTSPMYVRVRHQLWYHCRSSASAAAVFPPDAAVTSANCRPEPPRSSSLSPSTVDDAELTTSGERSDSGRCSSVGADPPLESQ